MRAIKRSLVLLVMVLSFVCFPNTFYADTEVPTEQEAYERIIALKAEFPEGMSWTNADYYGPFKGGHYHGGCGCAGFAFRCSDEAFGDLPAVKINIGEDVFQFEDLRVGDILRINDDTHSVVVLERYADKIVLAEGNYGGTIHWGRVFSKEKVMSVTDYVMTRYPHEHEWEAPIVEREATCSQGKITKHCRTCTKTETEYTPAVLSEHTLPEIGVIIKEATCTSAGRQRRICTVCEAYSITESIPKTGHTRDAGTVVVMPTPESTGLKEYTCTTCGAKETETLYYNTYESTNGWVNAGGTWYYYINDTKVCNNWVNDGGTWYYMKADGSMATGWVNDGGTWYYMNGSGAMVTGWVSDGGTWYYMNGSGAMTTGWVNDGGTWYYMNGNGSMITGWITDGGTWYYMNGNGSMATGWVYTGGNWYYMNGNGSMATGWVYTGGNWYCMDGNGAMVTGWVTDGSNWYYMNESGAMVTGNVYIDDTYYYFNNNGVWIG